MTPDDVPCHCMSLVHREIQSATDPRVVNIAPRRRVSVHGVSGVCSLRTMSIKANWSQTDCSRAV